MEMMKNIIKNINIPDHGERNIFMRITISFIIIILFLNTPEAAATPEYSSSTGQSCKVCHTTGNGGELNKTGNQYSISGYIWPPGKSHTVIMKINIPLRFLIGLLHIIASFLWFGTILYVHLLLRPGYASKGLPRQEVLLGIFSMAVVGISGVLLTASRISSIDVFFTNRWGIILFIKIILYMLMISSAFIAVKFIGPRLKLAIKEAMMPKNNIFDTRKLTAFDGKGGRKAFIAYQGSVYDVTGLKLWKNGVHMKHNSGIDLTNALPNAPHSDDKLIGLDKVGAFDPFHVPPLTAIQKAFYVIAYLNLGLVFAVLFVISLWKWGH